MFALIIGIIWTFAAIAWAISSVFWFKANSKGIAALSVVAAVTNAVPAVLYFMEYMKQ